jgi:hypothetical protein
MPQPKYHVSAAARQAAYRKRCDGTRRAELASKGLPSLPAISTIPGWPRWNASIEAARELVERTVEEMQEYFDDRSEVWQESERAEEYQEKIDSVQTLLDAFGELTL